MQRFRIDLFILELFLVVVATIAANELRNNYGLALQNYTALLPFLIITALSWTVASLVFRTHRSIWRYSSLSDYLNVVWAALSTALAAAAIAAIYNRLDGVARSLPVLQFLVMCSVLIGARVGIRVHHSRRHHPRQLDAEKSNRTATKTVLLVGVGPLCELYLRSVEQTATGSFHVAGVLGLKDAQAGRLVQNYRVLGTPEAAGDIVRDLSIHGVMIDEIVVTVAPDRLSVEAREALDFIERATDIRIRHLISELGFGFPGMVSIAERKPPTSNDSYSPLSREQIGAIGRRRYWKLKRFIDVATVGGLLLVGAPIMLFTAVVVAFDVGMPVTFWQRRPGLAGCSFNCYKFRTMRAAHDGLGRALSDLDRATSVGQLLRRLRLDELPQLFNVLRGEMSLVGPRPLLPVDQPADAKDRLLVRPGLTGWAQVCGGRDVSPEDKSALDIWYIRHASLKLDFEILLRTAKIVTGGERVEDWALRLARDCGQSTQAVIQPYKVPALVHTLQPQATDDGKVAVA